jgi:hypothetical protein
VGRRGEVKSAGKGPRKALVGFVVMILRKAS